MDKAEHDKVIARMGFNTQFTEQVENMLYRLDRELNGGSLAGSESARLAKDALRTSLAAMQAAAEGN